MGYPGHPPDHKRCTAKTRAGGRCLRWALKGSTVCLVHGGYLPSVRRKAKLRLALREVQPEMRAQLARDRARIEAEERFLDQVEGSPSIRKLLEEDQ